MSTAFDLDQFKRDRDRALLSMDRALIEAYLQKYGQFRKQPNEVVFWAGVHKARTACTTLPTYARIESKRWLVANGFHSMDDGEVPA